MPSASSAFLVRSWCTARTLLAISVYCGDLRKRMSVSFCSVLMASWMATSKSLARNSPGFFMRSIVSARSSDGRLTSFGELSDR
jgi:hypothetical protein